MSRKGEYCYDYPRPAVTADCVVFAKGGSGTKVLLIERFNEPYKGFWALPGGFIDMKESAEEAAGRELEEETGLKAGSLEQIGAYSNPERDPRGRVITIAFMAVVDKEEKVRGGDDAKQARWFALDSLPQLAFDHATILNDALKLMSASKGR